MIDVKAEPTNRAPSQFVASRPVGNPNLARQAHLAECGHQMRVAGDSECETTPAAMSHREIRSAGSVNTQRRRRTETIYLPVMPPTTIADMPLQYGYHLMDPGVRRYRFDRACAGWVMFDRSHQSLHLEHRPCPPPIERRGTSPNRVP